MMDRTFHQHFSLGTSCGIILFAVVSFWLFWQKWPVPGLITALACVALMERMLHSEYIFHEDQLIVYHGRFARKKVVPLSDIVGYKPITATFGLTRFLLLGLRGDRFILVQPDNEQAFVKHLAERKKKIKRKDENI